MKIQSTVFFLLVLISCSGPAQKQEAKKAKPPSRKVSIPLYFGFNNDNYASDSTLVRVIGPDNNLVFENKGYKPFWGLQEGGNILWTGTYTVNVIFYPDSLTRKEIQEQFEISGDEKHVELSINLMNGSRQSNEVWLNKYFDNKYNVQLKRLWDPQKQFSQKKELLPDYEWTNTYDSTIYGIYRQFSSSSMVNWIRLWNIGYMKFQKFNDTSWLYLDCNAPRINAELKKDTTGQTLKDMVLSCPSANFQKGKYRVIIEYGINNAIYRTTKAHDKFDSSFYYEPQIYTVTDEFTLQ
jgi:hypothetical protein